MVLLCEKSKIVKFYKKTSLAGFLDISRMFAEEVIFLLTG